MKEEEKMKKALSKGLDRVEAQPLVGLGPQAPCGCYGAGACDSCAAAR